jgi:hypothetical protein
MRSSICQWFIPVTILSLSLIGAAQAQQADDPETAAIRNVVQTYISPDPVKVGTVFLPAANLYVASDQGEVRVIPLSQFLENIAKGAAAGQQRPVMSIDFIDRVGTAATVRITEISATTRVTDYFSLVRGKDGWKIVSKTFNVEHKTDAASTATPSPATKASPCPSNEAHTFDYMVGYWSTSESPAPTVGAVTGTSRTERILNGCAIWEHRYVEQNGKELFDAHVVWGYDVTTKRMLLFYVDDAAHTQLYEGKQENGGWAFYRERPDQDGKTILIRVTYAKQERGFTQTVERSKDHGTTWEKGSVTTYGPKS